MNEWLEQAAKGLKAWAPLLDDKGALEIAQELYMAWGNDTPGIALRKFLHEVPVDWNQMPELA
ncbi:hypothetical protein [Piscinibacter gummiphilus]|uniref:Uncharacterized protein n=1 Tax=Piscinibacter gummiphilus TaxID=946333 RepID=A0ABZ0D0M5_9BURK|nr:hypothetical protein [Piscinibacter gummiphilus]WOB10756.1 hypothetical protein RXV79_12030 [Piscinibacter gummiphilus]